MKPRLAVALCLTLVWGGARADVSITYRHGSEPASRIDIHNDRLRLTSRDAQGQRQIILFDAGKRQLTVLDPARKTYLELDEATLARQMAALKQMRSQMRALMKAQIAKLPPEQREQAEARLQQQQASTADKEPDITLHQLSKRNRLLGVSCRELEVHYDGKPKSRVCLASAKNAGLTPSDAATLQGLYVFLEHLQASAMHNLAGPTRTAAPPQLMKRLNGVAMRIQPLPQGEATHVVKLEHQPLPADTFVIPEGYTSLRIPGLPGN
ncbi:MAG: hypothetical protein P8Y64_06565 [Gammaproteobacteria bacterium]|jgi:hypothetical protein